MGVKEQLNDMIKRKAPVGQNCQDNKCQRSSRSMIIKHFVVAANEYSNVVGERFWRDCFFLIEKVSTSLNSSTLQYGKIERRRVLG